MGRLLLIGLSVLLLAMCIGYTGWYFWHIEGFAEAKSRYSNPSIFQSKSNYSNHTFESKTHISKLSLNTQPKAIPISVLNTTQKLKRQVIKMDRLIKQTGWLNQQQSRKAYTVARLEEKNSDRRWTVGRLDEPKLWGKYI